MKADSAWFYGLRRSRRKWQFSNQSDYNICTFVSVKKVLFIAGYVAYEVKKSIITANSMEIEKLFILMF